MLTLGAVSPWRGGGCDAQTHLQWEMPGAWSSPPRAPLLSRPIVPTPVWHKLSQSALASRHHHERGGVPSPDPVSRQAQIVLAKLYVIIKHSWSSKTGYLTKDLPLNHLYLLSNKNKIKQTLKWVVEDTYNWASNASWNGNNAPLKPVNECMEPYVRERGSCYNVALLHIWVANKNWRLKCHCRKFVLAWYNLPRCCIIIRSKVQSQISNTIGLLILALILAQTGSEDEIAFHLLTERFQLVGWCCDSSVMYSEIPGLKSSWGAPECARCHEWLCQWHLVNTLALNPHRQISNKISQQRNCPSAGRQEYHSLRSHIFYHFSPL